MPNMPMNPYAANPYLMRQVAQKSTGSNFKWYVLILFALVAIVGQMAYSHWQGQLKSEKRLQKML